MYTESWGPDYATNSGQYRGNDHYMVQYSFGYSNSTNPGSPNPLAAVYQARNDVLWPGNSAQPYCSSILGYTASVTTTTIFVSATASATITVTSSGKPTMASVTSTAAAQKQKRALVMPDVLSKYPANIVTSACSLASQPASSTSIVTVTSTQTA
jgi:hypothetical protein